MKKLLTILSLGLLCASSALAGTYSEARSEALEIDKTREDTKLYCVIIMVGYVEGGRKLVDFQCIYNQKDGHFYYNSNGKPILLDCNIGNPLETAREIHKTAYNGVYANY